MDKLKRVLDAIVKNNVVFVIALIAAFDFFAPLGILLLLYKAGVFQSFFERNSGSVRTSGQRSQQTARMEKYRIMTEGRSSESISYLASAVGVPYATALRDLQQMVSEGAFGPEAYINYVDKTLVLVSDCRRTSGGTDKAGDTRSSGDTGARRTSEKADADRWTDSSARSSGVAGAKENGGDASGKQRRGSSEGRNSDRSQRRLLLVVGIILLIAGCLSAAEPLGWILGYGFTMYDLYDLMPGLLMAGGGVFSICYQGWLKKRSNRFMLYKAAIAGRDYVTLEELASKAGVSVRKLKKDLEAMLDKGLLPPTAYIDHGSGALVLVPGANAKESDAAQEDEPSSPPRDDEDRYRAILKEIRALNDAIEDAEVSERIDEIEDLTARIFKAVQEKPEKLPQIKSFMSYYLPTTLKLLGTYASFESSGVDGDNIKTAKAEIERILDTLVDGFRKQLDKLFESDAMDIASDIDVLENMLRRDGLAGDGSAFGSSASSGSAGQTSRGL